MIARGHAQAKAPTGWPAGCILAAAMFFNAGLAIVNAHVVPLQPIAVIACEAVLLVAAHLVILTRLRPDMIPWYLLLLLIVVFGLLRAAGLEAFEAKYVRDVALIPTFLLLGSTFPRRQLAILLVAVHAAVLAGLLLEWLSLDGYASLFAIKDYYIRTRGTAEEGFWNTASTLFVSATRPDNRFFAFVDWHRMSSLFLEPVSLGNYCIIVAACICAFPGLFKRWQLVFLVLATGLMLVGCDGRLATVTILAILGVSVIAPRLPPHANLLVPLLTVLAGVVVVMAFDLQPGADSFPSRVAHTVDLLRKLTLDDYMGMSNAFLQGAVDSGITYLVITQSIFVTGVLWAVIVLFTDEIDPAAARFKAATAIFVSLSLFISFSFLSIKTAALLWFVLGALQPAPARWSRTDAVGAGPSVRRSRAC